MAHMTGKKWDDLRLHRSECGEQTVVSHGVGVSKMVTCGQEAGVVKIEIEETCLGALMLVDTKEFTLTPSDAADLIDQLKGAIAEAEEEIDADLIRKGRGKEVTA